MEESAKGPFLKPWGAMKQLQDDWASGHNNTIRGRIIGVSSHISLICFCFHFLSSHSQSIMSTQGFSPEPEPFHYWGRVIDLISVLPGATILEDLHLDSESSGPVGVHAALGRPWNKSTEFVGSLAWESFKLTFYFPTLQSPMPPRLRGYFPVLHSEFKFTFLFAHVFRQLKMTRTQSGRRPGSKNIEGNGQDLWIHVICFTAGDVHSH